jgi:membrane protein DedA with SNARE-associated domain
MMVAATLGSVAGAWALYLIAAWIGPERLHGLVARYGRWFRISEEDLVRAEGWFDRRGGTAVLVCRCVPLVRSLVSVPAGFRHMNPVKFTLLTALGSAVWNIALISAGYALGDRWEEVGGYVSYLQYLLYAVIAVAIGWFVWRRFLSPQARSEAP